MPLFADCSADCQRQDWGDHKESCRTYTTAAVLRAKTSPIPMQLISNETLLRNSLDQKTSRMPPAVTERGRELLNDWTMVKARVLLSISTTD